MFGGIQFSKFDHKFARTEKDCLFNLFVLIVIYFHASSSTCYLSFIPSHLGLLTFRDVAGSKLDVTFLAFVFNFKIERGQNSGMFNFSVINSVLSPSGAVPHVASPFNI